MLKNYLQIYFQKKGSIKSLWVASGNGDRKDSQRLRKSAEIVELRIQVKQLALEKRTWDASPAQTEVSERGSVSCLSFPSFEDFLFLKGIVCLSIERQTDENTCRVELHFLKQSRVKNRTGHQISHVFLWFLSTGYWLIFHKPKSCGARVHMRPLY